MKNTNCALIIRTSKQTEYLLKEIKNSEYTIDCFSKVESLENKEFYDVILIHESFIAGFDRKKFPVSQIIVLTDSQTKIAELYPKLKDLHIFTIVQWPVSSSELIKFIEEAYSELIKYKKNNANEKDNGKSIVITSFANGTGKTLISYNIAAKIAQFFMEGSVSLVDMNMPFSASRALLNIQDTYNWHSIKPLLQESVPQRQKIQNIVYNTKYNFSLLSGPTDYASNSSLSKKEFQNLEKSLKNIFKTSIFDFHTIQTKEHIEYMINTDLVIIVVNMTSQGLLQTSRGLAYIQENSPELMAKIQLVFNGVDEKKGRTSELLESKLNVVPFSTIDEDIDAVNAIIENGELFSDNTLLIDNQLYRLAEKIVKKIF